VAAVLDGVKVVEAAGWTFVPAGGGVLADWGADVIKIEHPETGDPQRGLSIGTVGAKGAGGVRENGYVRTVTGKDGETTYDLVANPVQFDETPPELTRAPDSGEHTDEILEKELGLDWDAVVALKLNNMVS
jgi:crotonobetainyl-CoA:carnitine CoA-transferase CaiB-like acyl-CoA transferase